jgi:hypothetical protein
VDLSGLTYPPRLVTALFNALQQTAGPSSLGSVLDAAGLSRDLPTDPKTLETGLDFAEVAAFSEALETLYGVRGGRGIALRMGNALFALGLRDYGALRGVMSPQFQRLPLEQQAQVGLVGLAQIFSHISGQTSQVEDHGTTLAFVANPSPFAWGRTSDEPVCHVLTGILQASLRRATDGHEFVVYETACQAAGANQCVFRVNKKPVGRV